MPARDMDAPSAGLRQPGVRLRNKSNDIIRASMVVPAGAELETDEYVAAQLLGQDTAFEVVAASTLAGSDVDDEGQDDTAPPAVSPASPPVEEAGGGSARARSGRRRG